jgi:pseudaminic acid cytidylyltransferase
MNSWMNRLLIIPARGGSKRIPRKNMHKFGGIPALHRTIELAISSELFDLIVVSSDDDEILRSVAEYPVDSQSKRPEILANDSATVTDVLKYEVSRQAQKGLIFREIWQLSSFAFLLTSYDLEVFAQRAKELPSDGLLIGVLPIPCPLDWALQKSSNDELIAISKSSLTIPSQNLKKYFYDSGAIAVFNGSIFGNERFDIPSLKMFGLELAQHKVVDVDNPEDLRALEILFLGHQAARSLGFDVR